MKIKRWDVSVLESRKVEQRHDADFFTSDTDAWVELYLRDANITPAKATIIAYNRVDDSLVEEEVDVKSNLIRFPFYNEDRDLIEHSGGWVIRAIFQYEGRRYTTRDVGVYINGTEHDDIPERLEIVDNWNSVQAELDSMRRAEEVRQELYYELKRQLEEGELQGEQGPQGEQGIQGETGPQGEPFLYEDFTPEQLDGLVGPQGESGADGYTPVKGVDYFDGEDGADGLDGEQGPVGPAPLWEVISADEYDTIIPDPNTVYLVTDTNMTETDLYKMAVDEMLGGTL